MNERLALMRGADTQIKVWAEARPLSAGSAADDDFTRRGDRFRYRIHRTAAAAEFLSDIAGAEAMATRAMPGRMLSITSASTTPDRRYIIIECYG